MDGVQYLRRHGVYALVDRSVAALAELVGAKAYLRHHGTVPLEMSCSRLHGIVGLLSDAVVALLSEQPADPKEWLASRVSDAAPAPQRRGAASSAQHTAAGPALSALQCAVWAEEAGRAGVERDAAAALLALSLSRPPAPQPPAAAVAGDTAEEAGH
eukprot:gene30762-64386_t